MAKFITITDVTFIDIPNSVIKAPQTIIINIDNIKKISTENNRYSINNNVCTVIRVLSHDWGYIVTESMEELMSLINSK